MKSLFRSILRKRAIELIFLGKKTVIMYLEKIKRFRI